MANTGVLYRRGTKLKLSSSKPLIGEVVYAVDTEEYGTLVENTLVWKKFLDEVLSVSGRKGHVTLTKEDVDLSNVDNTSDLDKPISIAVQNELDNLNLGFGVITKESLGLGNVDNTGDIDKPVSTAVENRLFTKLDKTSPSVDTLSVNGVPSSEIASKSYSYSKAEADDLLIEKANLNSVYSKLEINNAMVLKADADSVFTKNEILDSFEQIHHKGQINGYASLDANGKVPASQLTQSGVVGYNSFQDFPAVGKDSTIYIDKVNDVLYVFDIVESVYKLVGSSSNEDYIRISPMRITVGGATAGTTFGGTVAEALDKILYPYILPAFSSFSSDLQTFIEIGSTQPAGSYHFLWTTTDSDNIEQNTVIISEEGVILVENIENTGNTILSLDATTKSVVESQTFTIEAKSTKGNTISKDFNVNWVAQIIYGSSIVSVMDDANIRSLQIKILASSKNRTYNMPEYGYKWICYPVMFGLSTSIKDPSTGFNIAIEAPQLVTYITDTGLSLDYYCYRTTNQMAGSINISIEG